MAIPGWLEFEDDITLLAIQAGLGWVSQDLALLVVDLARGKTVHRFSMPHRAQRAMLTSDGAVVQCCGSVEILTIGGASHSIPRGELLDVQEASALVARDRGLEVWDLENRDRRCFIPLFDESRSALLDQGRLHRIGYDYYEVYGLDGHRLTNEDRDKRVHLVRTDEGMVTVRHHEHPVHLAASTIRGGRRAGKFKGHIADVVMAAGRGVAVIEEARGRYSLRVWTGPTMQARFRVVGRHAAKLAADAHTVVAVWRNAAVWCSGEDATVHAIEGDWRRTDAVALWDGFPIVSRGNALIPLWPGKVNEWVVDGERAPGPQKTLEPLLLPNDLDENPL